MFKVYNLLFIIYTTLSNIRPCQFYQFKNWIQLNLYNVFKSKMHTIFFSTNRQKQF